MAKSSANKDQENQEAKSKSTFSIKNNPLFKKSTNQLNNVVSRASLDLYGTDRNLDIDYLNDKFQSLLKNNITSMTSADTDDITSFISKVWSEDKKSRAFEEMLTNQFNSSFGGDLSAMQTFFYDAYKSKLMEQNDLHNIASQLIELSEAILITRDAIIAPDIIEGRMSRTIDFNNAADDESAAMAVVEKIEEKFDLLNKVKNFIIPKTLEYGEYYAYVIPYARIFKDFMKVKTKNNIYQMHNAYTYKEVCLTESFEESPKNNKYDTKSNEYNRYIKEVYNKYLKESEEYIKQQSKFNENYSFITEKEFSAQLTSLMGNITVCNDPVPLPIVEEGASTIEEYMTEFVNESGTMVKEAKDDWKKLDSSTGRVTSKKNDLQSTLFDRVNKFSDSSEGITGDDDKDWKEIRDCYMELLDPTKVIPVKIMNTTIGYYIVHEEDITPLTGAVANSVYISKIGDERSKHTIVDAIVNRVVAAFDKKFLLDNTKFKKEIADVITFYNIQQKKIKFQFVPVEFMQVFKIDVDEQGNGQSMLKKSLFYAKLYLMLLLFKIMSIVLYSNDTRVNYIRQSGIDKQVANKIQEIARQKQSRQINIMDLFSYTTLINKVGAGSEMYIPVGRNETRPIETEILSGQDIQLNNELMEMLKTSYILATGVPQAMMNYLSEADFAKTVEQNNSKYVGRVVNYQLDFNPSITEFYKRILRASSNLSDNDVENFKFVLQPPKTSQNNAQGEAIQNVQQMTDFIVSLMAEDPQSSDNPKYLNRIITIFKRKYVEDQGSIFNMDKMKKIWKDAEIEAIGERTKPDVSKGKDDDDLGFDDLGGGNSGLGL